MHDKPQLFLLVGEVIQTSLVYFDINSLYCLQHKKASGWHAEEPDTDSAIGQLLLYLVCAHLQRMSSLGSSVKKGKTKFYPILGLYTDDFKVLLL